MKISGNSKPICKPDRRDVLKYGAAAGTMLAMPFVNRTWAQTIEINMLAWYGHGEPDIVGEFEAANNVTFKPKYYAGGENMLALIAQSPPGTYDCILSDAEFVQQLNAAGYIEELNPADYNFDDMLHEDFTKFPGHWADSKLHSVMVRFGHLGVSYNKNAVSAEEAQSYACFWKDNVKGKVGHFGSSQGEALQQRYVSLPQCDRAVGSARRNEQHNLGRRDH